MTATFHATKNRSRDRAGWCAIFYHPIRKGRDGKPLRVRKGLGTRDDAEADGRTEQLNRLLSDRSYWTPTARPRAEREFDHEVVRAFYDDLEIELVDGWKSRDAVIPLPGRDDGFTRVLVLGSTGAGKTTFVRQLIGSHPVRDRFPSTATAKTTTAAIEIVMDGGPYRAAVSFFPQELVRGYVEECAVAAVSCAADGGDDDQVMAALMEDREQRFRLAYILGRWETRAREARGEPEDPWGDWDGGEAGEEPTSDVGPSVDDAERAQYVVCLRAHLESVRAIAARARSVVELELGSTGDGNSGDREAFLELLEDGLFSDPDLQLLVDEILDEIGERFAALGEDTIERGRDGWPVRWRFGCDDRATFLRTVNRFTSNYAPSFGKLLTPIVEGIRVAGNFRPDWLPHDDDVRLVLMDGEGLGHTTASSASLPSAITKAYPRADLILLVDSAKQPMLAAPVAALRDVASNGYDGRLAVLFTHFDLMARDNVANKKAARDHVMRSIDNAVVGLEQPLGSTTARALHRNIRDRVFFAAGIHEPVSDLAQWEKLNVSEMRRFLALCREVIAPPPGTPVVPVYDSANLVLCVARATAQFQQAWEARLGIARRSDERPEHWTRVRALTRRLGLWGENEYSDLRPIADLKKELTESVTDFIANPREWEPRAAAEEDRARAAERVRQEMSLRIQTLVEARLRVDQTVQWQDAYAFAGTGSGLRRSLKIWGIYQEAAPVPTNVPNRESTTLLDLIRSIFLDAVTAAGGRMIDTPAVNPRT